MVILIGVRTKVSCDSKAKENNRGGRIGNCVTTRLPHEPKANKFWKAAEAETSVIENPPAPGRGASSTLVVPSLPFPYSATDEGK